MVHQSNARATAEHREARDTRQQTPPTHNQEMQPCPRCGHPMPALKGGSASICTNCGFKDSCCY